MEARELLKEDTRRSIMDRSFISAVTKKWEPFLEGLKNPDVRGITAIMMENESNHLKDLSEETRAINIGSFTKFIFPILRRVFPNLIAHEIVSVQPMTAPVGAVFYLDLIYGTQKGGTTAGAIFPRDFDRDYSSEYINGEQLVTGNAADFGGAHPPALPLNAVLAFTPVRPLDASRGYSVVLREEDAAGTIYQTATDDGAGGFVFSPAGGNTAGIINYSNGNISGFWFQNAPGAARLVKAYYYYDGELNSKVPQISLDIKKAAVEAIPRRIKSLWSSEAAEDLRAFHGLDAETELVANAAQEMALEIDREIIQQLFLASTGTTATFDRTPPAGIPELDHLRAMLTQISTVANLIHKKTLRAPANFLVTSPEISSLLAQLTTHGDFRPAFVSGTESPYGPADAPRPLVQHGQFGIYKAGTLMNKWTIYEDPFFTRDRMLIGLKGGSFLDAGFVFAPYVPLQVTPTFLDPNDFSFRKGLRTRYATKLTRPEYYGQLRVLHL